MMKKLIELLNTLDVSAYKINVHKQESFQLFFVHEKLETIRSTDTKNTYITIYMEHGDFLGSTTFQIYDSLSLDELKEMILDAKEKALAINDRKYSLNENDKQEFVSNSNFKDYSLKEMAYMIADELFSAEHEGSGALNATEVFVYKNEVSIINSKGVNKKETYYTSKVETIPTWNGDKESVEVYQQLNFTEFNKEDIKKEVESKLKEAKARYYATRINEAIDVPVLLGKEELNEAIASLAKYSLNYRALYSHSSPYKVGDNIQSNPQGDKLSLSAKGEVKGVFGSAYFDNDGTTLKDKELIKDGKITSFFGSKRFAEYTNNEVTGNLEVIEIKGGSKTIEELKKEKHLECLTFSGIQCDPFLDYIGGEVRLAIYFDGEKEIPITGISISGKLSEVLNNMYLSKELGNTSYYHGPEKALFKGFKIF